MYKILSTLQWFIIFKIISVLEISIHIVQDVELILHYTQMHITVSIIMRVKKYFEIGYVAIIETTRIYYRHIFTIRLKAYNHEERFLKLRLCLDIPHMTGGIRQ